MSESGYSSQSYWSERKDLIYYNYIDYIVRTIGVDARSLIDIGTGNCPYLDWFDWIPEKVSLDIRVPYESEQVKALKGDIFKIDFGRKFDLCTCFQVLEHVPAAGEFCTRLLEIGKTVVVSVPYKWGTKPRPTPGHVHDPVSYEKLTEWMGRKANYKIVVEEPFGKYKHRRLIAIYEEDEKKRYPQSIRRKRIRR